LILTDREIKISIENEAIVVDPPPDLDAYASTSLDLALDASIKVFPPSEVGLDLTVDPGKQGYSFARIIERLTTDFTISQDGFVLEPKKLILGWTKERIELRTMSRIAARIEGKSSLARLGLAVHVTAPTIHAGFTGRIQLEIINHGHLPIRLRAGMYICQLIFEQTLGVPDKRGIAANFLGSTRFVSKSEDSQS
jgi:dCTP deaminase